MAIFLKAENRVGVLKIYFYRMTALKLPIYQRRLLNSDIVKIKFFKSLTLVSIPVIRPRSGEVQNFTLENTSYR